MAAELLGLYIVIGGVNILPQCCGQNIGSGGWRTGLVLWAIVVLSGVETYRAWYVTPFR